MHFICLRLINLNRRCLEQPLLFGWRCLQYQHNQLYVLHPGEAGMCTQRHVTHFSVFCAEAFFLSVSFVLCVFYISHKRCYGGKSWAGKWIPLGSLETQMSPRYVTYGQCKGVWDLGGVPSPQSWPSSHQDIVTGEDIDPVVMAKQKWGAYTTTCHAELGGDAW